MLIEIRWNIKYNSFIYLFLDLCVAQISTNFSTQYLSTYNLTKEYIPEELIIKIKQYEIKSKCKSIVKDTLMKYKQFPWAIQLPLHYMNREKHIIYSNSNRENAITYLINCNTYIKYSLIIYYTINK